MMSFQLALSRKPLWTWKQSLNNRDTETETSVESGWIIAQTWIMRIGSSEIHKFIERFFLFSHSPLHTKERYLASPVGKTIK